MNGNRIKNAVYAIFATFVAALLIAECRQARQTHDAVIRLETLEKAQR